VSWVLFFDGECGFCSKSVRRVYRLDRRGEIEFAPLQGELAGRLGLEKYAEKGGGSVVFMRESDGVMFLKGDAVVELGKVLGGQWGRLAVVFSVFPKSFRDWVYDLVARNRFRLAEGVCEMPDEGLRKRMRE
jgi:predicted DCC family thiol-disulfide oxidoreductase YuxK